MKEYIIKVARDLENGVITEEKARTSLLGLFGVGGSGALTVDRVGKMLNKVSKEAWIAAKGDETGYKTWWNNRNKLNVNI